MLETLGSGPQGRHWGTGVQVRSLDPAGCGVRARVLRDDPGLGHQHPAPSSTQVRPAGGDQHSPIFPSPWSSVPAPPRHRPLPEKGVRARVGTRPATSSLSCDRPQHLGPTKGQEGGADRGWHSPPPCASRPPPNAPSHHSCLLVSTRVLVHGDPAQLPGDRPQGLVPGLHPQGTQPPPPRSLDFREGACDSRGGVGCGGGAPPGCRGSV